MPTYKDYHKSAPTLVVRLDQDYKERLQRIADREDVSMAQIVRDAIDERS